MNTNLDWLWSLSDDQKVHLNHLLWEIFYANNSRATICHSTAMSISRMKVINIVENTLTELEKITIYRLNSARETTPSNLAHKREK